MERRINKQIADDDFEKRKTYEQPLTVDLDGELKTEFQIWCLQHGRSMKEIIRLLLTQFLAEQKEKKVKKNE